MTQAQKIAYINNDFSNRAQEVFNLIRNGEDNTIPAICEALGLKQNNQFTGRISDLLDAGLIEEVPGGKYSKFKAVTDVNRIKELAHKRYVQKFHQWKKKGEELGLEFIVNTEIVD